MIAIIAASLLTPLLFLLAPVPRVHAGPVQAQARATKPYPFAGTTPFAGLRTFTSPSWTIVPPSQRTGDPFCQNEADPDNNIGNFCVCKNGATIENIPHGPKTPDPNWQPCAYTTVPPRWGNSTAATVATRTGTGITWSPSGWSGGSSSTGFPYPSSTVGLSGFWESRHDKREYKGR